MRRMAAIPYERLVLLLLGALLCTGCLVDSGVFVFTWHDTDCDGQQDDGEVPLVGIPFCLVDRLDSPDASPDKCFVEGAQTDSEGRWSTFVSGGGCGSMFVLVQTPGGYEPTTDTVSNDCVADFGFAQKGTCPDLSVVTPARMATQQRNRTFGWALFWGAGLLLFVAAYRKHRSETRAGESGTSGQ